MMIRPYSVYATRSCTNGPGRYLDRQILASARLCSVPLRPLDRPLRIVRQTRDVGPGYGLLLWEPSAKGPRNRCGAFGTRYNRAGAPIWKCRWQGTRVIENG